MAEMHCNRCGGECSGGNAYICEECGALLCKECGKSGLCPHCYGKLYRLS